MTEPPDFDRLFSSVTRSAVHLEMRDDYGGSSPAFSQLPCERACVTSNFRIQVVDPKA